MNARHLLIFALGVTVSCSAYLFCEQTPQIRQLRLTTISDMWNVVSSKKFDSSQRSQLVRLS